MSAKSWFPSHTEPAAKRHKCHIPVVLDDGEFDLAIAQMVDEHSGELFHATPT